MIHITCVQVAKGARGDGVISQRRPTRVFEMGLYKSHEIPRPPTIRGQRMNGSAYPPPF